MSLFYTFLMFLLKQGWIFSPWGMSQVVSGTRIANAKIARALRRSPWGPSIEWDTWDKWDKWDRQVTLQWLQWLAVCTSLHLLHFVPTIHLPGLAVQVAEGDLGILAGSLGAHPKDSWCCADAKVFFKNVPNFMDIMNPLWPVKDIGPVLVGALMWQVWWTLHKLENSTGAGVKRLLWIVGHDSGLVTNI